MTAIIEQKKHDTELFVQMGRERAEREEEMEMRRMRESQAHELRMAETFARMFAQSNQPQTRYPDGMHDGMSFMLNNMLNN